MLKRIKIRDIFQFINSEFEFKPGINVVVGPNGAGKTNLFNVIKFALYGDLPTNKQNCLNRLTDGDGIVILEIETKKGRHIITRNIKKNSHEIINKDTGDKTSGYTQVNVKIFDVLEIPERCIKNHVFIDQNKIKFFVESTTSERVAWLQKILEMERITKLWREVNALISVEKETIDQVKMHYKKIEDEYEKLKSEMGELNANIKFSKEECEAFLNALKEKRFFQEELSKKATLLDKTSQELSVLEQKIQKTGEVNIDLDFAVSYRNTLSNIKRATTEICNLFKNRQKIEKINVGEIKSEIEKIEKLTSRIDALRELFNYERDTCPICGQILSDQMKYQIKLDIESFLLEKETKKKIKDKYLSILAQHEIVTRERKRIKNHIKSILSLIKDDKKLLKELKLPVREVTKELEKISSQIELVKKSREECEMFLKRKGEIEFLHREIDLLKNKLEKYCNIDDGKAYEYEKSIENIIKLDTIKSRIQLLEDILKNKASVLSKERKLHTANEVKEILHPSFIVGNMLHSFVAETNKYLNNVIQIMGMNFTASLNNDFEYKISYEDGKTLSEKELSNGEQLVLSLAQHFSISYYFGSGIIVLDEPTLGLDEIRVNNLTKALKSVVEMIPNNMQILCGTHEIKLSACADNVIEINVQK